MIANREKIRPILSDQIKNNLLRMCQQKKIKPEALKKLTDKFSPY